MEHFPCEPNAACKNWPHCYSDVHHLYYPACDYKTRLEKEFRDLEVNKIAICRAIHDEIHAEDTPPDKPSHQFMCEEVREPLR